jgi:hypothetical protein
MHKRVCAFTVEISRGGMFFVTKAKSCYVVLFGIVPNVDGCDASSV